MKVLDITFSRHRKWRKRESKQAQGTEEVEEQILVALEELQEFIGKILETSTVTETANEMQDQVSSTYFYMADLNREVTTWYQNLPRGLQWTASNSEIAPLSFFLLQYV
jgi:hypothetical protein